MPHINPNSDGQVATTILDTYINKQIIPNCNTIFAGGDISEDLITQTRETFQKVNSAIAQILADLPA